MEIEKDRHQLLDELSEPIRTSGDVQMFLRYIYKAHPSGAQAGRNVAQNKYN